jgi:GNAT superfamily N-acetyltransferase
LNLFSVKHNFPSKFTEFAPYEGSECVLNPPIKIIAAGASEEPRLIETLVLAFETDPLTRWAFCEPDVYHRLARGFFKAFGGRAVEYGSAYYSEDYAGVALWLPPGVDPDQDAMMSIFLEAATEQHQASLMALMAEMGNYHPHEPHWYLPLIGVSPSSQGMGYGAALMKHALLRCDAAHCTAYLESSSPRNVPLYERHGFELMGTIQVGSSPPVFPMLRRAR